MQLLSTCSASLSSSLVLTIMHGCQSRHPVWSPPFHPPPPKLHDLHVAKPAIGNNACLSLCCAVGRTRIGHCRGFGIGIQQHLCDSAVPREPENPLRVHLQRAGPAGLQGAFRLRSGGEHQPCFCKGNCQSQCLQKPQTGRKLLLLHPPPPLLPLKTPPHLMGDFCQI